MIDRHLEVRRGTLDISERLKAMSHQYRVIEKRLLARFKDPNHYPIGGLDVLMEATHTRILDLADELQRARRVLAGCGSRLACSVRFVALLLQLRFQLGTKAHALLLFHLHPGAADTEDQVIHASTVRASGDPPRAFVAAPHARWRRSHTGLQAITLG